MYGYLNLGPSDGLPPYLGIASSNPGEVFDFNSGWLSAGWSNDLELTVQGYRDGSLVAGYESTISMAYRSPGQFFFDYSGIDEVRFCQKTISKKKQGAGQPFFFSLLQITPSMMMIGPHNPINPTPTSSVP